MYTATTFAGDEGNLIEYKEGLGDVLLLRDENVRNDLRGDNYPEPHVLMPSDMA